MNTRRNRFVALMRLAGDLPKHPSLMMLIGFLTARLDRVRLVTVGMIPPDAEVRIEITTPMARIWTGRWFRAWLGTAEVPDPVVLISALSERDTDIYVAVDFGAQTPDWLQEALDPSEPRGLSPKEHLDELRSRVDHALDVYNECRKLLNEGDQSREKELQFILDTAKHEIQQLSKEIERLKAELSSAAT